jgi:D-proline reductase (dithiol) PrdB
VSAIAYYLEEAGIATTGISLVRENTESMKPPRFLWATFPLGRPLGKPGDRAFQHRVIMAALALLERSEGPVLEDFLEEAPAGALEDHPACPVTFARPSLDASTWAARLHNELMLLRPWYDASKRRRGRTTVGVAGLPVDALVDQVATLLDGAIPQRPALKALKYAVEDLKAYYQEALTAQPGEHVWQETQRTFWRETELGRALKLLDARLQARADLRGFSRILVPREALES